MRPTFLPPTSAVQRSAIVETAQFPDLATGIDHQVRSAAAFRLGKGLAAILQDGFEVDLETPGNFMRPPCDFVSHVRFRQEFVGDLARCSLTLSRSFCGLRTISVNQISFDAAFPACVHRRTPLSKCFYYILFLSSTVGRRGTPPTLAIRAPPVRIRLCCLPSEGPTPRSDARARSDLLAPPRQVPAVPGSKLTAGSRQNPSDVRQNCGLSAVAAPLSAPAG